MQKIVVGRKPNQLKMFLSGCLFGLIAFGIPLLVVLWKSGALK